MTAKRTLLALAPLWAVAHASAPGLAAQSYLPALDSQSVVEARTALDAMKRDARGPYLRIRWFCRDGSVQPPQGSPCRERGGGVQHAEYNDAAKRLWRLGFHPGTILQATTFEELYDAAHAHDRLKQLILDQYLFEIDDGWVLRQARYYRGARQAEDEEASGTAFLQRLLSNPAWVRGNYWLAYQAVATVPHTGLAGDQSVQRVRNLATEAAELEPAFLQLRIKIHSFPSRDDLDAVVRFLGRPGLSEAARAKLVALRDALRRQYDQREHIETLAQFERRLSGTPELAEELERIRRGLESGEARPTFVRAARLSSRLRELVTSDDDGRRNLLLFDLNRLLHEHALVLGVELEADAARRSRAERLADLLPYFSLAEGAGFLSPREKSALEDAARQLMSDDGLTALEYRQRIGYLARSLDWATSHVRSVMVPALDRYIEVEPKTAGFGDATVRGSILLPLSTAIGRLAADGDEVLGAYHVLLPDGNGDHEGGPAGMRGLNPGVARGLLEFADELEARQLERSSIYVLPETTPELRPVAGVLTLDAGNLLSHVQLLARNLGIPNASVPSRALDQLEEARGRTVFYAVSPLGRVIVKDTALIDDDERALLEARREVRAERHRLDTSRLRLDHVTPIPLGDLRSEHSGVYVGPKAANLGQLAAFFPDRVAPGVALPFGMFRRHVDRPLASGRTILEELAAAYARAGELRALGRTEDEIDEYMFGELARVRTAIVELEWLPDMRERIVEAIRAAFGDDLSAGIFVRSDTNVEDLPQFSGAGLNLTLPNRRTVEDVLAAIKQVWTSPFRERPYLWRKQVLDDEGRVYPSVLLLRSVPSEKSGVMITSGLQHGGPDDLTIATAEGVAGAVDGEDAETIVVGPDGSVRLLSQARSPLRRVLGEGGGALMVPALRPEYLLLESDIRQLRDVVETWKRLFPGHQPGRVWDFEFGFVDGHLWLFQVRPFIRFRSSELLDRLAVLDRDALRNADRPVSLDERI